MTLRSFEDSTTDEARQFLLDRRCERTHPKRHRTLGRAKRLSAKKRKQIRHRNALRLAEQRKYRAAVHAYWTGESSHHP